MSVICSVHLSCISAHQYVTVLSLLINMSLPCHQSIHSLIIIMSNCLDHHSYCCCIFQAVNVINFFTGCLSRWRYICHPYSCCRASKSTHTGRMLEKVFKSALAFAKCICLKKLESFFTITILCNPAISVFYDTKLRWVISFNSFKATSSNPFCAYPVIITIQANISL